jgi:hypothetical protein
MQISEDRIAPVKAIDVMYGLIIITCLVNIEEIRIKPYPPSFRRTAAKIIEPATGAST